LTAEQRKELRSIYDGIKEKVAKALNEKERSKFARE
jgi:hypothetical protein